MEEPVKIRKAQGHKEKRCVSSIEIEVLITHPMCVCPGDVIVLNTINPVSEGNYAIVRLILDKLLYLDKNDKIKIKSELSPSIVSVVVERAEE